MNIHKFVLVCIVALELLATAVSAGFYFTQRDLLLHTVADDLNRSFFRLEREVQKSLQNGRWDEIQAILDESAAINHTVAEVSVSKSGQRIDASSSRVLVGAAVDAEYLPVSQLHDGLTKDGHSRFKSDFYYFDGASKHTAQLLIHVDESYVFGRLNQLALYFGLFILLLIAFLTTLAFVLVRRLLVQPLERVTQHAREASTQEESCFITELSELNHALRLSFQELRDQQQSLKSALDETRYLDGILRTVADINQLLITSKNVKELVDKSTTRLARHSGYALCWIAQIQDGRLEISAFSADARVKLAVGMSVAAEEDEQDVVTRAIRQGKSIVIQHIEKLGAANAPWAVVARQGGYGAFIALPLLPSIHEAPVGVLGLYAERPDGFSRKEVDMLEELAGDIGFAIRAFEQRAELEYHLTTDAITALPNRTSLVDQLAFDRNAMLAIINIDRFSDINEVYGISTGDGLLAQFGQWLQHQIANRRGTSLYKIGGDEYVLLFSGGDSPRYCLEFLEQLVADSAKATFAVNEIELVLTITIGFAEASERALEHATAALRQAKSGRQSMQMYVTPVSRQEQENNIAWYKRIKAAIEESRIVPYFQPIVDNQTRRVIKYEALARLVERDGTVFGPQAFLGIAKKTRLYSHITRIMIEKTAEAFENSHLSVSLNLSTEDLLNNELADMIEKTIMAHHMGQVITFEILESEGIENYAEVSAFVDHFKSLGCRFAIDDFGSGYSNFDHLLKLNIDTLKIDGSLIKILPHDRNARIFVKHIRDFAHEMGIATIAEFVANEEIFVKVKELGIDASQGYFFYEPSAALIATVE